MNTPVDHGRDLVTHTIRNVQPVELSVHEMCQATVKLLSAADTSSRVQHPLKFVAIPRYVLRNQYPSTISFRLKTSSSSSSSSSESLDGGSPWCRSSSPAGEWPRQTARCHSRRMDAVEPSPIWCSQVCLGRPGGLL